MGALDGLKILDFSTLLPGPYATLLLADLGAEVLKVSSRDKYDLVVHWPPEIEGSGTTAAAAWLGRNKKTIFLNLKKPSAVEAVKRLILEYDILVEQFRPGVLAKLGLDYETLRGVNPRLIYCSLTGYGQTGPLSPRAGHDINYMSRSGVMASAGRKATGPVLTNMQVADVAVGSMNSVVGILAAVHHRDVTGRGQYIDVAMLDGLVPFTAMDGTRFLATGEDCGRESRRLNGGSLYGYYETKDGEYLSVGSLEPKFWAAFCTGIGCPDLIEGTVEPEDIDTAGEDHIYDETRYFLMSRPAFLLVVEWCVEPVVSLMDALLEDDHFRVRNLVVEVEVPCTGGKKVKQLGSPMKLSECPVTYDLGGYPLGYHTQEVIGALGLDYAALKAEGVFD